jgi:c(7)-type cytochrome triheme protein
MRDLVRLAGGLLLGGLLAASALAAEGDVVFRRQGGEAGIAPALFPHWIHRIRYGCAACHDSLASMRGGGAPVTMEAIAEGRSCGACHDGKRAWGVTFETCNRCHPAR